MSSIVSFRAMSSNLSSISAVAGSSSPSPGPTSGSGGFMSRVASLFSSSSTAKTSTPSSSRASSGTGGYGRKYGLKPHPKVTRDGIIKRKSYDTYRGRLRVPSGIYARRPTPEIIKGARYGELKGFLGNGEIIPAAEFEETVNPVTAEIFLDQDVLFETDHLSDEEESMDEDLRESSNLYYIAVNPDELPTYHFWRKRGEVDPMEHSKPSGLGRKEFTENTLDSDYEVSQDNSLGGSPKAMDTGKAPQTSRASQDDQMWDGRYGNEYDPTRSYYSNARNNLEWAESGQGFRFSSNGMAKTSRQRGESLVRSEDPTGWKQSAVNGKFLQPQRIRHHVDPLEFLDFYNEKANGNIMLRSTCTHLNRIPVIGMLRVF